MTKSVSSSCDSILVRVKKVKCQSGRNELTFGDIRCAFMVNSLEKSYGWSNDSITCMILSIIVYNGNAIDNDL